MANIYGLFPKKDYGITSPIVSRSLDPPSKEQISEIERSLSLLPEVLGSEKWSLSGGIALQLAYGSWYRMPGNINLSIEENDLFDLADKAQRNNYRLLSRGVHIERFRDKYETYEVPEWRDITLAKNYPNLRFIRFEKERPSRNHFLSDFIDVHIHRVVSYKFEYYPQFNRNELHSIDKNETSMALPEDLASQNFLCTTANGPISVRSLEYMKVVKEWLLRRKDRRAKRKLIDEFDMAKIYEKQGIDFNLEKIYKELELNSAGQENA